MPTPSDHIDMIMSTKATAFATIVILAYISIRSTVNPPSRRSYESPTSRNYCVKDSKRSLETSGEAQSSKSVPQPNPQSTKSKRALLASLRSPLLQREIHGHRHDDRHRLTVEQRRRVLPLFHGVERRRIKQRNRPQHFGFLHVPVWSDHRFDDDHALDAR